jgi:hypothetical protein
MDKIICYLFIIVFFVSTKISAKEEFSIGTTGFEENKGQIFDESRKFRSDVHFVARISNASVFFTENGIVFYFKEIKPSEFDKIRAGKIPNPYSDKEWENILKQITNNEYHGDLVKTDVNAYRIDLTFPGANLTNPIGEIMTIEKRNYYTSNVPNGIRDIPVYERVRYKNAYPGIDLIFYLQSGKIKYDFEVSAKANPSIIKILYKGHQKISIDSNENAIINILPGKIIENKPISFQDNIEIETKFNIVSDSIYV